MSLDETNRLSWIYELHRLGQDAALNEDTSFIYQQILTHIAGGFEAKSGSLVLRGNKESDFLTIIAGIDLPAGVIGSQVAIGEGVLGWVAKEGQPLLLSGDISNDPRFQLRSREGGKPATNSAICWPHQVCQHLY